MSGRKIIESLKDAVAGNFSAVTIEGQRWVRADALEPGMNFEVLPTVSLRDYFAIQFARSIYAHESTAGVPAKVISSWAYKRADAMLAEREKR